MCRRHGGEIFLTKRRGRYTIHEPSSRMGGRVAHGLLMEAYKGCLHSSNPEWKVLDASIISCRLPGSLNARFRGYSKLRLQFSASLKKLLMTGFERRALSG